MFLVPVVFFVASLALADTSLAYQAQVLRSRQTGQDLPFTFKAASFNIRNDRKDNVDLQDTLDSLAKVDPLQPPDSYYSNMTEKSWANRRVPLVEEMLWNNVSLAGRSLYHASCRTCSSYCIQRDARSAL